MDILSTVLVAGLACGYLVRILLLEKKISHEGPFVFPNTFVLFRDGSSHIQRFTLFDAIRFLCGAYVRVPEMASQRVYTLRDHWIAELWTCPLCFSFWAAFLPNFLITFIYHPPFLLQVIMHLAIACLGYLIYDWTEN